MTIIELKAWLLANIKPNGIQAITGGIDQDAFINSVDTLNSLDISTYLQPLEPTDTVKGSLWFKTTDSKLYRYNGSVWSLIELADTTTASNGLTKTGNDIKLGGTLTANTTINAEAYKITVNDIINSSEVEISSDDIKVIDNTASITMATGLPATTNGLTYKDTNEHSIFYRDNHLRIESDLVTFTGLNYDIDYSANFVDRSLIDKAYSDLKIAIIDIVDNVTSTDIDKPLSANQGKELKELINSLSTSLTPQGNWDASTNTPTLPGTATTGQYWIVNVAGVTDIGGITDWEINDWVIKTADGWAKIDNTDKVLSVNSNTGVVVLNQDNVLNGATYVQTHNDYTDADALVVSNTSGTNTGDQTASNGLALLSGDIKLGGTLSGNTTINTDGNDLIIEDDGGIQTTLTGDLLKINASTSEMRFQTNTGTTSGLTFKNTNSHNIYYRDDNLRIQSDLAGFTGVQYALDYSSNFDDRSLVDKAYVDDNFAWDATTQTHSSSGSYNIDFSVDFAVVTVTANITSLTYSNVAVGKPVLRLFIFNGTADLTTIPTAFKPTSGSESIDNTNAIENNFTVFAKDATNFTYSNATVTR